MLKLKRNSELMLKNEKIANSFVELLVFPTYVSLCLIRTILASLGIFIIGFFVVDLVHVEYVIYGLIGFILFLAIGIQIGILILSWKIKSDIYYIVKFTLEITESALTDINKINSKITKVNRKEVFGLLFKGIIHIVTIPTLSKVIIDKVPFVAGLVNKIVKRVLILVTEKIKFSSEELEHNVTKNKSQLNANQTNKSPITSVSTGLAKVMNFNFWGCTNTIKNYICNTYYNIDIICINHKLKKINEKKSTH